MLLCNQISKKFQNEMVLEKFSYQFNDTGFYLLFGESGSGKTTFLNILSGLLIFDEGSIRINGMEFCGVVNRKLIADDYDYITQDSFFVDFLNVMDNLLMVTNDKIIIEEMLTKFGLLTKKEQYPGTLSGGERQRLAIIRALIAGKRVLFLDEPTASLDGENKLMIFEMLASIKSDVLVICSSHDMEAKEYADEIIEFEKTHKEKNIDVKNMSSQIKKEKISVSNTCTDIENKVKSFKENKSLKENKPIAIFLKKWFQSGQRNKKSSILFCIFLTIAMCICSLADTPQNKMDSNIEYVYKVNMCMLRTNRKEPEEFERLREEKGISEVVLDYSLSVPIGNIDSNEVLQSLDGTYEMNVPVLPFHKTVFKLADKVKYGTYFTEKNQIILSAEMAERMMGNSPEKLIGQTLVKEFYGVGETEFEIVGIFDYFNDFEKMYLKAMGIQISSGNQYHKEDYENMWFINSEFTKQYADDLSFYSDKQRGYILFFKSYKDMKSYYNANYQNYKEKGDWLFIELESGKLYGVFKMLYQIFLPLSFFVAFFTTLFYISLIKTELVYNNQFISVFDYAGYPVKNVIRSFIFLNLKYQMRLCIISALFSFMITNAVNIINRKYMFFSFQIFTYNVPVLMGFIIFLIVVSVIFTIAFLDRFKTINWYENMIKQRDLI